MIEVEIGKHKVYVYREYKPNDDSLEYSFFFYRGELDKRRIDIRILPAAVKRFGTSTSLYAIVKWEFLKAVERNLDVPAEQATSNPNFKVIEID